MKPRLIFSIFSFFIVQTAVASDQIYKTAMPGEQLTSISVLTSSSADDAGQVLSYCLQIQEGKTADVRVVAEVTNNLGDNVGVGYNLKVSDYTVDHGQSTFLRSYMLNPSVMTNVTLDMHHLVIQTTGIETMTKIGRATNRCYTLVVWAAASSASGGASLQVEKGYGQLTVSVR